MLTKNVVLSQVIIRFQYGTLNLYDMKHECILNWLNA